MSCHIQKIERQFGNSYLIPFELNSFDFVNQAGRVPWVLVFPAQLNITIISNSLPLVPPSCRR